MQTLCTLFAPAALSMGKIHLYAGIAAGILFLNTVGKLTMLRRIHSNFRFVSSREQKYAVRVFDDYNTSLKMAGSSVISQPAIAYQQKAGFLKRFLQISYEPDPAETSSQVLAPVGLISSLLLCVVALVIHVTVCVPCHYGFGGFLLRVCSGDEYAGRKPAGEPSFPPPAPPRRDGLRL